MTPKKKKKTETDSANSCRHTVHSHMSRQTHIHREKENETEVDHSKIMRSIKRWTNKENMNEKKKNGKKW